MAQLRREMNRQELRQLDVKLATELLGIKKVYYSDWDEDKMSPEYIPSGKPWRTHQIDARPIPCFTLSLDACVGYLVPKIRETHNDLRVVWTYTSVTSCGIYHYGKRYSRKKNFEWLRLGHGSNDNLALALCLAIVELIDGGAK